MKRHIAVLMSILAVAAPVSATTVDLSWETCHSVVADKSVTADLPVAVFVSVTGHSLPHRGYEFWMAIGDESNSVPDAWRFDVAGCQGPSMITIDHIIPALVKACPSFQGALASLQIKSYQPAPPDLSLPAGMFVAVLANAYGQLDTTTVVPASRYYLGRIYFDHTFSVPGSATEPGTCGGLEHGMCLRLIPERCNWVNEAGEEVRFDVGRGQITANGGCQAVPAATSTWGQIKGQYRR